MLLKDPSCDQSWETRDVFQNLAERQRGPVSQLLGAIDRRLGGIVSCVDDLSEQARFCASTKSSTKFKLPTQKAAYARSIAYREWMELEVEFLSELSQTLDRNVEGVRELLRKAEVTVPTGGMNPEELAYQETRKSTRRQLERHIATLEAQINEQSESTKKLEALAAPHAALQCQAASVRSCCSFLTTHGWGGEFTLREQRRRHFVPEELPP